MNAALLAVAAIGPAKAPASIKELTFLTRDGCVNTPDMVFNLDDAHTSAGRRIHYTSTSGSYSPAMCERAIRMETSWRFLKSVACITITNAPRRTRGPRHVREPRGPVPDSPAT